MKTEYERVIAEVKRLEAVADDLQLTIPNKIVNLKEQSLANWRGEASIKFQNELDELINQLKKESKSLDANASALKKVAKLRKETAEKAAQLTSGLGAGGPMSGGGSGGGGGGGSIGGGRF